MEESRNLAGQLGSFNRDLGRPLERNRNRMGAIRMLFGHLVRVHQRTIDVYIRLNEPMELSAQIEKMLFSIGLSSEARSHHSQGSCQRTGECCDTATGRGRCGVS